MTGLKAPDEIVLMAIKDGNLEFEISNEGTFLLLKLYRLKFCCDRCDEPHMQIFTDRRLAEKKADPFPKTNKLPDNTEPQNPHEWSIFPFVARVRLLQ